MFHLANCKYTLQTNFSWNVE